VQLSFFRQLDAFDWNFNAQVLLRLLRGMLGLWAHRETARSLLCRLAKVGGFPLDLQVSQGLVRVKGYLRSSHLALPLKLNCLDRRLNPVLAAREVDSACKIFLRQVDAI